MERQSPRIKHQKENSCWQDVKGFNRAGIVLYKLSKNDQTDLGIDALAPMDDGACYIRITESEARERFKNVNYWDKLQTEVGKVGKALHIDAKFFYVSLRFLAELGRNTVDWGAVG
jgi:hypothetical protein